MTLHGGRKSHPNTKRNRSELHLQFSASVSAARNVTFALQASLSDVHDFKAWYRQIQSRLKSDPLAPFFLEIRNESVHMSVNRFGVVSPEHLREHLAGQLGGQIWGPTLIIPEASGGGDTRIVDAVGACRQYFQSLVEIVYEYYAAFKYVVDPCWHYTKEGFASEGRSFADAVAELGYSEGWLDAVLSTDVAWKLIRYGQQLCPINDIFERWVGKRIDAPD